MGQVAEAFEGGLAGVSRRCHQDKEIVVELALLAQLGCRCAEEARQALQRHVLEGAGGAVPQLKDMGVGIKGGDGADALVVEVVAIGLCHKLVYDLSGKVDAEGLVDACGALRIGQLSQLADLIERQLGDMLRNVQSAAICQAVDNGLGEFNGLVDASARIDIAILLHGLGASFGIAKRGIIHGTHNIPAKVQMEDDFPVLQTNGGERRFRQIRSMPGLVPPSCRGLALL